MCIGNREGGDDAIADTDFRSAQKLEEAFEKHKTKDRQNFERPNLFPVAADATIPRDSPAPSPAAKKLGMFVSRFLFTIKRME